MRIPRTHTDAMLISNRFRDSICRAKRSEIEKRHVCRAHRAADQNEKVFAPPAYELMPIHVPGPNMEHQARRAASSSLTARSDSFSTVTFYNETLFLTMQIDAALLGSSSVRSALQSLL